MRTENVKINEEIKGANSRMQKMYKELNLKNCIAPGLEMCTNNANMLREVQENVIKQRSQIEMKVKSLHKY